MSTRPSRTRLRLALAGAIVLLVLPGLASGLAQLDTDRRGDLAAAENVTFVTTQGSFGPSVDGRVVAIDTDTREIVWEYSSGAATRQVAYYDVDPLSAGELLVVEQVTGDSAYVLHVRWREDRVVERFPVPLDTHDVDYLGDGRYAVADKFHHRGYVYDRAADEVVWEYNFSAHFPEYPEAGRAPSTRRSGAGGYTHLNDVDPVAGGEAFLMSPRNFDRVVLVDRETKAAEFVLGEQGNDSVLSKQHNPDLLSLDPPTVLVADSENDRVIEYRRGADGEWRPTWSYRGWLDWPRDADRLPDGNTLIVDSKGQRVLEVTPDGDVAWTVRVPRMPYDAERLGLPPGSVGLPTNGSVAAGLRAGTGGSLPRAIYHESLWIVPAWIGIGEFYGLLAALALGLVWLGGEAVLGLRR